MEASECAEQVDMAQKQRDREHTTQWTQKSGTRNPLPTSASVPKFEKIPWLCEASLRNKPLVLSLPRRYPHASATSLNSWRKDVNLPNTFQVPNGLSKARRNHRGPVLGRSRQLCSTCQEVKMVQPRTMMIPDDLKHSFENCLSHRMKTFSHQKPRLNPGVPLMTSQQSIHYRLPLLGPRTGAFHELLLSDSYKALRGMQLSSSPRKEPMGKTMRHEIFPVVHTKQVSTRLMTWQSAAKIFAAGISGEKWCACV
ncbi:hypothetical protein QTO34_011405 [Cnephaeus nilssonii]|uniref:Uncharacterized protein n=1 Tax=Cnephaeus nilssonii TaxID=3371016 RepID=A0AA40HEH3_CNENI|nr:hypothetical protein QTO34_011405 [Eptesicus nilssonii]